MTRRSVRIGTSKVWTQQKAQVKRLAAQGRTQTEISGEVRLAQSTVSRIVRGER